MQAQEFSSPASHMASVANSSKTGYVSNGVIYAGKGSNITTGLPPSFNLARDFVGGNINFDDIRNAERMSFDDYIGKYMRYNDDLYERARNYDMYMSNTAIRRQYEDLKEAGINPILAGRLGGAVYKGVNAPYINISPGQAYSADVSSNNIDKVIAGDLQRAKLNNDNLLQIARENNLNDIQVAHLMSSSNQVIEGMRDATNIAGQDKNLIGNIIHSGIGAIGTMAFIASHFKNKDGGSNNFGSGSLSSNKSSVIDRDDYNTLLREGKLQSDITLNNTSTFVNAISGTASAFFQNTANLLKQYGKDIATFGSAALAVGALVSGVPVF